MKDEAPVGVEIQVDDCILPCVFTRKISQVSMPGRVEYRFVVSYQVGFGFKAMFFYAKYPDGARKRFAERYFIAGWEKSGRKVRIPARARELSFGVNVIGLFRYSLGLGEVARNTYNCLSRNGVSCCPVNALRLRCTVTDAFDFSSLSYELKYKVNLFYLNPPEMSSIRSRWPKVLKNGQYNIGYWFFELARLPDGWKGGGVGLNEVWVASRFVYDAVKMATDLPVYLIPTPVTVKRPVAVDRSEFGIPDECFCVLSVFDMNSHKLRKNPEAVIDAFKSAVKQYESMHLVIKVNNPSRSLNDFEVLRQSLADLPNVVLISEFLTREKLTALQACADVFVSLHRSEGLGLNLLECMLLGKPVIATNWSANVDYMTPDNSCPIDYELVAIEETTGPYEQGELWAEPSIDQASEWLVRLAKDPVLAQQIGNAARESIELLYSPDACYQAMALRLSEISRI